MLKNRDTVPATGDGDVEERTLRIAFDEFGWQSAELMANRRRDSLEDWVALCCTTYAERLEGAAFSLRPPRFKVSAGEVRELRISLPPATWHVLEEATGGMDLERLVEHATISQAAVESDSALVRPSQATAPEPEAPPATSAWQSSARRRLAAIVAVAAGASLLPVGLAAAGLSMPDPVRSAFETLGIELPNQAEDEPAPAGTDRAAPRRSNSDRRAAGGGDSPGQEPRAQRGAKKPGSDGAQRRRERRSSLAGPSPAAGAPAAGGTPAAPEGETGAGTVPDVPSEPPDAPRQPRDDKIEDSVADLFEDGF